MVSSKIIISPRRDIFGKERGGEGRGWGWQRLETEGRRGGSQERHIWPGEGRGGAGLVMAETGNRREDMRFAGEAYLERRGAGHKTVRARCC